MIFEQLGRLLDLRCENKSNFHARYASGAEVLPDFWVFFVRNETKEVSIWNFIMFSTDVDNNIHVPTRKPISTKVFQLVGLP